MLLAQLSDTHILGSTNDEPVYVDNNGRLEEAVGSLNAENPVPDVVVATGDLTQGGQLDEYSALAGLVDKLELPFLPIPGNHDDGDRLRETFADVPWADTDHASWVVDYADVTLVGLDSTGSNRHGGEFDAQREAWLRSVFANGSNPIVLALHHPPFPCGIEWMDSQGFDGLDRLEAVLGETRRVARILCGHLHRLVSSTVAGVPAQTGLSTIQHVELDLRPEAKPRLINDPAGYMLHNYAGGRWVTHTRFIAHGEKPYRPHWSNDF